MKNTNFTPEENSQDELDSIAPFLGKLRRQAPEMRPEDAPTSDYFAGLESRLFETIDEVPNSPKVHSQRVWRLWWPLAAAASVLGGVFVWNLWQQAESPTPAQPEALFAAVSTETIQEYVLENIDDFDSETVLASAAASDANFEFELLPQDAPEEDLLLEDLEEDDLLDL